MYIIHGGFCGRRPENEALKVNRNFACCDGLESRRWTPLMDISEAPEAYKVMMETPGVAKEDMDIKFENSVLTVSGEKKKAPSENGERKFISEIGAGKFAWSGRFKDVNSDEISAVAKNGVLEITLPKVSTSAPKIINVEKASA